MSHTDDRSLITSKRLKIHATENTLALKTKNASYIYITMLLSFSSFFRRNQRKCVLMVKRRHNRETATSVRNVYIFTVRSFYLQVKYSFLERVPVYFSKHSQGDGEVSLEPEMAVVVVDKFINIQEIRK